MQRQRILLLVVSVSLQVLYHPQEGKGIQQPLKMHQKLQKQQNQSQSRQHQNDVLLSLKKALNVKELQRAQTGSVGSMEGIEIRR